MAVGEEAEELTREKTQIAIQKAFMDARITPFKPGSWKQYVQSSFMSRAAPKACNILHQVFKLQEERAVSAYLFKCGLDDQDPRDWDDVDTLRAEGTSILDIEVLSPDNLREMETRKMKRRRRRRRWRWSWWWWW